MRWRSQPGSRAVPEPGLTESESAVLPLNYPPKRSCDQELGLLRQRPWLRSSFCVSSWLVCQVRLDTWQAPRQLKNGASR
jgi:hypothetical protein